MALSPKSSPFQMLIQIVQTRVIAEENIKSQHTNLSSVPLW